MKAEGVKGFDEAQYDPALMGEFIVENLLGLEKAARLSAKEKEAYKREKYPIVMSFFKEHDLQPTLMNLRKNRNAILSLWHEMPENFTGEEVENLEGLGWVRFILMIMLFVVVLKILS